VEEEEQRILDTYEPIFIQDSDSDPEGMQDVTIISYHIRLRLKDLKPCVSFALKPSYEFTARRAGGGCEKRDIETLQGRTWGAHYQTAITGFFRPLSDIS